VSWPPPYSWTFEPVFLALAAVAAVLYVRAARHDRPGLLRGTCFALGLLLVAVALNTPLETIATHYLLLVHLLQNVMIGDWAPLLLVLGLTHGMRVSVGRTLGRPWAFLTRGRVALVVWLVGWYAIHAALFYDFALRHTWALNVEHAVLIFIGLVFWWPLFGREPYGLPYPKAVAYLGAAFVGSAFLGLGLSFAVRSFYRFYGEAPLRLWGMSPTKDQNFGGVLMSVEQVIVLSIALVWFLLRLLPEDEDRRPAAAPE
jgi:cytochrome c oxidase assembly factor CtaG